MINRIRDKVRQFKPQEVVSAKDWESIEDNHAFAATFLKKENPGYRILLGDLKEAEEIILNNRVHEVHELRVISEFLHKTFKTGKKQQVDELVGQIKYIRGYLGELQLWIDRKVELEKLEGEGKIVIERSKEKR